MKLLALDTATEALSVALWLDGELIERYAVVTREHAARLPLLVPELMAEAGLRLHELDGLVCGIGPGSFAGTRIGVSYVKGLALGLDRPVVGVTSLAMLAQAALAEHPDATALAAIDARMDEVYFGAYRLDSDGVAIAIDEPVVSPAGAIAMPASAADAHGWVGAGSGWASHRDALLAGVNMPPRSLAADAYPHAGSALPTALRAFRLGEAGDSSALVPAYLRNRVALTSVEQAALRAQRAG
jgi:tRNA threonylcarbamoyladenosine biosynthesis protein TsaB